MVSTYIASYGYFLFTRSCTRSHGWRQRSVKKEKRKAMALYDSFCEHHIFLLLSGLHRWNLLIHNMRTWTECRERWRNIVEVLSACLFAHCNVKGGAVWEGFKICVCDFILRAALCVFNGMKNLLLRQSPLTSLWSAPHFLPVLVMMRSNAYHDFISVITSLQGEGPELCINRERDTHTH